MGVSKGIRIVLMAVKPRWIILVSILLVLAGWQLDTRAQSVTNLYSFIGSPGDGGNSQSPLVQGSDGNLYGTAVGGTFGPGTNNYGTVFRISPSGSFANLHSFKVSDGAHPFAGLVQGADGNFYGTTEQGGNTNLYHGVGAGTVFRITPSGILTSLYSFAGVPDGAFPYAELVQGSDGNLYGTTIAGGNTNYNGAFGNGTVFRVNPNGTYSNLYSFGSSPSDGINPNTLVQGRDGSFYSTTETGGLFGLGTAFRISPSGSYTNLYSFGSFPTDGAEPNGRLVQGSDCNFYGVTAAGGIKGFNNPYGYGTVFRISPSGSYTNLYSFTGPPDGRNPYAGVVQGSDGNFYGTTDQGGTSVNRLNGCGVIFRISPSGDYSNLYSFSNLIGDGIGPEANFVQGSDGNFYGTTPSGGINNSGTVYRLSVPLNPAPYPINQITNAQVAATNVIFNVVSIAGETYQLQFSSSMTPTNWVNVPGVSVTNSIGALLTVTNLGGAVGPQGFYRFAITP